MNSNMTPHQKKLHDEALQKEIDRHIPKMEHDPFLVFLEKKFNYYYDKVSKKLISIYDSVVYLVKNTINNFHWFFYDFWENVLYWWPKSLGGPLNAFLETLLVDHAIITLFFVMFISLGGVLFIFGACFQVLKFLIFVGRWLKWAFDEIKKELTDDPKKKKK